MIDAAAEQEEYEKRCAAKNGYYFAQAYMAAKSGDRDLYQSLCDDAFGMSEARQPRGNDESRRNTSAADPAALARFFDIPIEEAAAGAAGWDVSISESKR